jgi:acetoacetate decarboxylase
MSTTDNRNGRLDVGNLPSNQPAISPLYPPPPWKVFNSRSIVVVYETDLEPVLDILPPDLSPLTDPPQIVCYMQAGYDFGSGGGSYAEMAPLIPVLYEGEPHIYPWVVYLGEGTEEWFAAGRECLADSKKLAKLEWHEQVGRGHIMFTVERPAGHRLVTAIVGPLESQGSAEEFAFLPVLSLRIIPDASGERPQIADLLRKVAPSTVRTASDGSAMIYRGPATIQLGVSEQDPLYKLPVRRVVEGMFVQLGTIDEQAGAPVKSYL